MMRLANVEDRAAANPRTFFLPHRADRDTIPVGSLVKLIFECCGERLWIEVLTNVGGLRHACGELTCVNPAHLRLAYRYTGVVRNHPVRCGHVRWGSDVSFGPEHVAAITHRGEVDAIPQANV